MTIITAVGTSAGRAVTRYAGSFGEMLPHFIVIAAVVAILVIAFVIYSRRNSKK